VRNGLAGVLVLGQLAGSPPPAEPAAACMRAAAAAEQRWQLPQHLLEAIGRVESGQTDPATGRVLPWPWIANVAGTDYVFASADAAAAAVQELRDHGVSSIDVGCFQINLRYHPQAFSSVTEGFQPEANADYAGRFLRSLFERAGSWEAAIGAYHSAEPDRGEPYRQRVLQAWRGFDESAPALVAITARSGTDPHVILSGLAVPIPVYTPATLPVAFRATVLAAGIDLATSKSSHK
jgi:hypothetical protein